MNFILLTALYVTINANIDDEKIEFCKDLKCDDEPKFKICGLRFEGEGVRLKLFDSECDILKYGCSVPEEQAYGSVRLELCLESLFKNELSSPNDNITNHTCPDIDCSYPGDDAAVCAIRKYETGYKIRIFDNKCKMFKSNCINNTTFTVTDMYICKGKPEYNLNNEPSHPLANMPNIIVINSSMLAPGDNYKESIENFFAATHITDIPLEEFETNILKDNNMQDYRRGLPLKNLKPMKAFKPAITRPHIVKNDTWHMPLINSCYHKCPVKCPDLYAPVCGTAGEGVGEPNMVFRNHCFMDAAQCKIYWEDKSPSAQFTYYASSSFFFCIGYSYGRTLRFLPVLRSLHRMGRLKKFHNYKHKISQFRNFYNLLPHELDVRG